MSIRLSILPAAVLAVSTILLAQPAPADVLDPTICPTDVAGDTAGSADAIDSVDAATVLTVSGTPDLDGRRDIVTGVAGSLPVTSAECGGPPAPEPAPEPRQKIGIQFLFWVDKTTGALSLGLASGSFNPDPEGAAVGTQLSVVAGTRYKVTLPALKGRDCQTKDLVVEFRGKPVPASVTYNDRDEPVISIDIDAPNLHNSSLDITLKCVARTR